jgi:flagellar protein FliO/FliZ
MILLTSSLNSFVQLLGAILIFLFVLALTYFVTKWLGGAQKSKMHNKNLSLVESLQIGTGKCVQIIKAGEVYLVIAVGKEEVSVLAQLTKEQLTKLPEETEEVQPAAQQFREVLDKFKEQLKNQKKG